MIRMAVVGTGGIAELHMAALRGEAHRVAVVAAVDVDGARVEAFGRKHEIPAVYTDLGEMLAARQPDLVHLCTPPFAHATQAADTVRGPPTVQWRL